MAAIRIMLVDDHSLVRAGLRMLLQDLPDVTIVAEAGNGREALLMVEEHAPDIVFMDIAMSEMNGLEAASRIARDHPEVKVVVLSMHTNEEYVLQALRVGASGYLLKDAATAELALAVQAVSQGETYLSPAISRHVIDSYKRRVREDDLSPLSVLTPRQREILQLIAEGHSTKEIAYSLGISIKTVEAHRAQLMGRLDIFDVAGLVKYAIRAGMVSTDV